jgi:hypothetical protein
MIEFKQDAYESLDTVLTKLGAGNDGVGWAAEVETSDGEVIYVQIVGPADEAWQDTHSDFDADTVNDRLASWPVVVQPLDESGYPNGERKIVIARRVVIL